MRKLKNKKMIKICSLLLSLSIYSLSFGQTKTVIGIMPFTGSSTTSNDPNNYYNRNKKGDNQNVTSIQDAVTDAFLKTKRFSLVEREKMDQIKTEKNLQKNEDFIDGQVIEQSKSVGAQFIILGNVSKADVSTSRTNAPYAGTITTQKCEIAFNIRLVDVATSEIIASNSFSGTGKGNNSFESALDDIKPDIEQFIRENFKVVVSVASIEEKNKRGEATKILIAGGSSLGFKEKNELKVYELSEMVVDGKKMSRKVTIGKVRINSIEDENFSKCSVLEGGNDIASKLESGAKLKCEVINE